MIEFAQMEPPFHEMTPMRVLLKIQKSDPPRLDHPNRWSREFNDFLKLCLVKDPHRRPTAEDLLKVGRRQETDFWDSGNLARTSGIEMFIHLCLTCFYHQRGNIYL